VDAESLLGAIGDGDMAADFAVHVEWPKRELARLEAQLERR
jgi:hypothetical protein